MYAHIITRQTEVIGLFHYSQQFPSATLQTIQPPPRGSYCSNFALDSLKIFSLFFSPLIMMYLDFWSFAFNIGMWWPWPCMFLLLFFSRFGKYLHNIFSNIFMLHSIFILEILCLLYSVIISKIVPDYVPFFVNVFSLFLRLNNFHLTNLLTLSSRSHLQFTVSFIQ